MSEMICNIVYLISHVEVVLDSRVLFVHRQVGFGFDSRYSVLKAQSCFRCVGWPLASVPEDISVSNRSKDA